MLLKANLLDFSPRKNTTTDFFFSDAKVVCKLNHAGSPLLCYVFLFITSISPFIENGLIIYYPNNFGIIFTINLHFNCSRACFPVFL